MKSTRVHRLESILLRHGNRGGARLTREACWAHRVRHGHANPEVSLATAVHRLLLPTVRRATSGGGGRRIQEPRAVTPFVQESQALKRLVTSASQNAVGPRARSLRLGEEIRATVSGDSHSLQARAQLRARATAGLSTLRATLPPRATTATTATTARRKTAPRPGARPLAAPQSGRPVRSPRFPR